MADGFLGRWSRRKQDVREGKHVQDPAPPAPQAPALAAVTVPAPTVAQPAQAPTPPVAPAPAAPPLPTLQDAQSLSIDSDFKPFVSRAVAPGVRNAAMKKLFTDPHFNVMDGLDIYIDDYTQPDPLPAAMLKEMASAQFMGLVEEEPEKSKPTEAAAESVGQNDPKDPASVEPPVPSAAQSGQDMAQSGVCTAFPSAHGQAPAGSTGGPAASAPASHKEHDHAHLRLQPDDAAERPGPGHSAS
ncbi:MAG: DUF3306 domain-containing protein [Verminephrobacter sp.]|nr:DUF3306 domain-containing protein [Verminephrobacter sp.]